MFLSPEHLEQLTGKKMPSEQIRQLESMGIKFLVNALNHPIVSVMEVERVLSTKPNSQGYTLNRDAIQRLKKHA